MTGSGRCHGPGCTQTADSDFCSARCQSAWTADVMGVDPLPVRPVRRRTLTPADYVDGKLPASTGATVPQVASQDPQVGWLAKWINHLFGRTT